MLENKNILLGVTGGIAAYKAAHLVRLLIKEGASVRVIMSENARDFITPLTLSTLSKHVVYTDFFNSETGEWHNHVALGLWADLLLIAPATAQTIAKCAHGHCDNLLMATFLSARCPVFLAPAMDHDMYRHPSTQRNLQQLLSDGHHIIPAQHGELASGLVGEGRMAEPEQILQQLKAYYQRQQRLAGKRALVTAGPTYEAIDPVRFIGNHSTGKMGYALAEALAEYGAEVVLVSGPTSLAPPRHPHIELFRVTSAQEMLEVCLDAFPQIDIAIMAAAVADYRPKVIAGHKIKKEAEELQLELIKNPDIAASLGAQKQIHQLLVGFALETENIEENAWQKLQRKNFDLIILNTPSSEGTGFGHDTNRVVIMDRQRQCYPTELRSKKEIAYEIVEHICSCLARRSSIPAPS